MTTALIFGVTGQDGSWLAEFLLDKGYEVVGAIRRHSTGPALDNLPQAVVEAPGMRFVVADLTDDETVRTAVASVKPDEVYNLAALSFVAHSWRNVDQVMDVNALGAARVFRAVRDEAPKAKVYQASSSEMYGRDAPPPQDELSRMRPVSPYGVSKLAAHALANVYRLSFGTFISCGICFNHESERRGIEFVSRKIARGVAQIADGRVDVLILGDTTTRRDWGYAPEYVRAMWLMLQQDMPDDFVIATGHSHTVAEFAESAFRHVGILDCEPYIRRDERLERPVDIPRLIGAPAKAKRLLGWQAEMPFDEMVARMVDAELEALNEQA